MNDQRRGILLVLGAALLWSSAGVGIKAIDDGPLKVAFFRSAIAAIALFAIVRPPRPRITPMFVTAIVSYAACLTTFVVATKWTSAANAIFLQYSGVVWVLLLAPVLLKEPMRGRDAVAIGVSLCGMTLLFVGQLGGGMLAGNLMAVLSSIFFALLVIALRKESGGRAETAVTWGNVLATVAIFPFIIRDLHVTPRSAAVLVFLGVFQIALAYVLFVRGLRHVTATQASLTAMLEPVANPIWVFLFLGERPASFAVVGGAIVLGAIAWRAVNVGPPEPEIQATS
ncbi:MAG TPA: EamA family transporter [Thermoanaerobaculia bacterium]|nr:EamA family transporter [Thermoanaerobaculia bacterium]